MDENILIVDDEIQILNSLNRLFKFEGYNIFIATSGKDAISILLKEKINLMVTDIRMPDIDGLELLKTAKNISPSTIRIVLSGYAKEDVFLKIYQNNLAKLYMLKPWNNNELLTSIRQIFNIKRILEQKKLLKIIDEIKILPSPANIYHKFELLVSKDSDMFEVANLIKSDPSIATKVLQVVNSAFYNIRTGSIKTAITYLGLLNVKHIILSLSIFNKLKNAINDPVLIDDIDLIWKHSMLTNKILNYLYKRLLNKKIPETCDMVGLLHDIGKLVIISNFTDEYLEATKGIKKEKDMYNYFETIEVLSVSHEEIGAYFLYWWELPQQVVECVLYQKPKKKTISNKELVSVLHIAEIFSWNIIGNSDLAINPLVLERLNLTTDKCNELFIELKTML